MEEHVCGLRLDRACRISRSRTFDPVKGDFGEIDLTTP